MRKFIMIFPSIIKIIAAILIILFFIPLVSESGISISCYNLVFGIQQMGMTVSDGSLWWIIFEILVPIAILIVSFMSFKYRNYTNIGLSIVGIIINIILLDKIDRMTYGYFKGSFVIVFYFIGYIAVALLELVSILSDLVSNVKENKISLASIKTAIQVISVILAILSFKPLMYYVSFGGIVFFIIPITIFILKFINNKQEDLIRIGLAVLGLILTGSVGRLSFSPALCVLGYIAILVLILLPKIRNINGSDQEVSSEASQVGIDISKLSELGDSVKEVVSSETVQQGISTTKHVAASIVGTFKDTAKAATSAIRDPETKKANSIAEQLITYKDLLDRGIITQEEFDRKKSELLK